MMSSCTQNTRAVGVDAYSDAAFKGPEVEMQGGGCVSLTLSSLASWNNFSLPKLIS